MFLKLFSPITIDFTRISKDRWNQLMVELNGNKTLESTHFRPWNLSKHVLMCFQTFLCLHTL